MLAELSVAQNVLNEIENLKKQIDDFGIREIIKTYIP